MKEFYNVDLTVINNADDNFALKNCTADLTLPTVKNISENLKSIIFKEVTAEILPTVLKSMGLAVIKGLTKISKNVILLIVYKLQNTAKFIATGGFL